MGSPLFSAVSVLMTTDDFIDTGEASVDPLDQNWGLCASRIFEDRDQAAMFSCLCPRCPQPPPLPDCLYLLSFLPSVSGVPAVERVPRGPEAGTMLVTLHSTHLLTQAETRLLTRPHRMHQDLGRSCIICLPVSSLSSPHLPGSSHADILAAPQTFQEHSCLRAFALDVCAPPEHSYFRPSSL